MYVSNSGPFSRSSPPSLRLTETRAFSLYFILFSSCANRSKCSKSASRFVCVSYSVGSSSPCDSTKNSFPALFSVFPKQKPADLIFFKHCVPKQPLALRAGQRPPRWKDEIHPHWDQETGTLDLIWPLNYHQIFMPILYMCLQHTMSLTDNYISLSNISHHRHFSWCRTFHSFGEARGVCVLLDTHAMEKMTDLRNHLTIRNDKKQTIPINLNGTTTYRDSSLCRGWTLVSEINVGTSNSRRDRKNVSMNT